MRYVLDTDVLVASLRSKLGASRQLIVLLGQGHFDALASVTMLFEYEAVLKRTKHLRVAKLTTHDIDRFLDNIADIMIEVEQFYVWRPQLRDPADEHVLATAINGRADAIVTFNTRHFQPANEQFGIDVIKPNEALHRIINDK